MTCKRRGMTRLLRLAFVLLPTLAFVSVVEAGPIIYFDSYRSLNVNGTLYENTTAGRWSADDRSSSLVRSQDSYIGEILFRGDGRQYERIAARGSLNAFSSEGPFNGSTDLFTSFVLDVPHTVDLNVGLLALDYGHAEGFFYNETTQTMLAQAAGDGDNNFFRLFYQGLLEPGV